MKISIATIIRGGTTEKQELNLAIKALLENAMLEDAAKDLERLKFISLRWGRGGNHIWVKQLDINQQPTFENILIATND